MAAAESLYVIWLLCFDFRYIEAINLKMQRGFLLTDTMFLELEI